MKSKLALKQEHGFTLVELLIVIAIIGLLMGLALAGMRFAQERARDLQRQNAVRNISAALEAYYVDNREYPTSTTVGNVQTLVETYLDDYLENTFELPGGTEFDDIGYVTTSDGLSYLTCIYPENSPKTGTSDLIMYGTDSSLATQCAAAIQ